jgi:hypothetical protein
MFFRIGRGGMICPERIGFLEPELNRPRPEIAAPHNQKAVNTQYLAFLSRHRDIY